MAKDNVNQLVNLKSIERGLKNFTFVGERTRDFVQTVFGDNKSSEFFDIACGLALAAVSKYDFKIALQIYVSNDDTRMEIRVSAPRGSTNLVEPIDLRKVDFNNVTDFVWEYVRPEMQPPKLICNVYVFRTTHGEKQDLSFDYIIHDSNATNLTETFAKLVGRHEIDLQDMESVVRWAKEIEQSVVDQRHNTEKNQYIPPHMFNIQIGCRSYITGNPRAYYTHETSRKRATVYP